MLEASVDYNNVGKVNQDRFEYHQNTDEMLLISSISRTQQHALGTLRAPAVNDSQESQQRALRLD